MTRSEIPLELLMREAGVEDLDGLDRVMLVISDNSADRNKMAELVEKAQP